MHLKIWEEHYLSYLWIPIFKSVSKVFFGVNQLNRLIFLYLSNIYQSSNERFQKTYFLISQIAIVSYTCNSPNFLWDIHFKSFFFTLLIYIWKSLLYTSRNHSAYITVTYNVQYFKMHQMSILGVSQWNKMFLLYSNNIYGRLRYTFQNT